MIIHDFNPNELKEYILKDCVILDFYADWCGPCKMLSSVLEEYSKSNDKVYICKINVDKYIDIAKKFGVMTIPALFLYKEGKLIKNNIGYLSLEELNNWINSD